MRFDFASKAKRACGQVWKAVSDPASVASLDEAQGECTYAWICPKGWLKIPGDADVRLNLTGKMSSWSTEAMFFVGTSFSLQQRNQVVHGCISTKGGEKNKEQQERKLNT